MGRVGLGMGTAVAALFLGGCGFVAPADGSPAASTPVAAAPTTRFGVVTDGSASSSTSPEFPLTLRRTGGIAGFDDRIVLESDGSVRVDTRTVRGRVCTLSPAMRGQLVAVLASLRLGPVAPAVPGDDFTPVDPGAAPESDPITISVTDDLAREIDLDDPSLGEISGLVGSLVSDVTLSVPATTRCVTPTTGPAAAG